MAESSSSKATKGRALSRNGSDAVEQAKKEKKSKVVEEPKGMEVAVAGGGGGDDPHFIAMANLFKNEMRMMKSELGMIFEEKLQKVVQKVAER